MPLSGLADEIVRISRHGRRHQHGASTPVLVTPKHLSLRNEFLVELSRQLLLFDDGSKSLRIDWLCNASLLRQRLARFRAVGMNAALRRHPDLADRASVVVAGSIGRSHQHELTLVLGLSDQDQDLPTWARKIQLGGLPRNSTLQFS